MGPPTRTLRILLALGVSVAGLLFASDATRVPAPGQPAPSFPPPFTGGPLFPRPFTFASPQPVQAIAADWNGDGVGDLAVPGFGGASGPSGAISNGEFAVLLARGDGTFESKPKITSPTAPTAGVAGDFNADARPDLLLADQRGSALALYPGNGTGGFGTPVITVVSLGIAALAAADVDGDGRLDAVAVHPGANRIQVFLGSGDGHFSVEMFYATCEAPTALAAGDVDRDGDVDLVIACAGSYCSTPGCSDSGGAVAVHTNPGDGSFGPAQIVAVGRHYGSIAIGDLLADGNPDIVASTVLNGGGLTAGVDFIDGHGPSGFAAAVAIDTGAPTAELTTVDLNRDGRAEVGGIADPSVEGNRRFSRLRIWSAGPGASMVLTLDRAPDHILAKLAAGDFNRDGFPDLAVVGGDQRGSGDELVETYLGDGDGRLVVEECVASGRDVSSLSVADLNHDALPDILALEDSGFSATHAVRVLLARLDGTYAESDIALPAADKSSMIVDDFTGDGESDVAVLLIRPQPEVHVFRGVGDGTFVSATVLWSSPGPIAMAAGHFDQDDITDLALLSGCADSGCIQALVALFKGRHDGRFEGPHYAALPQGNYHLIAAGDFDADGRDEIVVTNASSCCRSIRFRLESDWSLTPLQFLSILSVVSDPVETIDFNGDSIDDLRLGQHTFLGHPGTGLSGSAPFAVGTGGFTVADLNGDDVPDPVGYGFISLFAQLSDGAGGFSAPAGFLWAGLGTTNTRLDAADMNGDGRTDIVFSGQGICIAHNLAGIPDLDHDGLPDSTDSCVDPDVDGHADRVTPSTTCPPDNCVGVANLSQIDTDQDGQGDACDICPFETANDPDHDGLCDAVDRCPGVDDQWNGDLDGDGVGDTCDVCPSTSDPGQDDSDFDGSGDACQPSAALRVYQDGSPVVEVQVGVSDPQHDVLITRLSVTGPPRTWKTPNIAMGGGDPCSRDYSILPPEFQEPGSIVFGYLEGPGGIQAIADSDSFLPCDDGNADYLMASGPCSRTTSVFDTGLDFQIHPVSPPISICIAHAPEVVGFLDLTLLSFDRTGVVVSEPFRQGFVDTVLPPELATTIPLAGMAPGVAYVVELETTDGNTHPVRRAREFVYRGETTLNVTADADHDGLFDGDDPCVDQDADGRRDPVFAGTCDTDNCPFVSNAGQQDADADAIGDACDPCTDSDGDGGGDVGYPANTCAVDNCPMQPNPGQADTDGDLVGDACDTCNDSDQDGYGDAAFPPSVCSVDNCRLSFNPDQADADADRIGDLCDNCPEAVNPGQEDENADGSGDACQPRVAIDSIAADGAGSLVASGRLIDPQGETLHGTVTFTGNGIAPFTLHDALATSDCSLGYLPDGIPGKAIGYANGSIGVPALFDLDFGMSCEDGRPDYRLALGSCGAPASIFDTALLLDASVLPMAFCVRPYGAVSGGQTLFVDSFDLDTVQIRGTGVGSVLTVPFSERPPDSIPLALFYPGETYVMRIEVTDGNTQPRSATAGFAYLGESTMLFDFSSGPRAVIASTPNTECAGAGGAVVILDGSSSTDPDSTPGSQDDIAAYDWYENYGLAGQRPLGTGAVIPAALGLGSHAVTLKVTDQAGETSTATTTVSVVDTLPPVVECAPTLPAAECTGAGGAYVTVGATANDLCGGAVALANDRTSGGADASGAYPLGGTSVTFTATDARGLAATCVTAVNVVETQPPTLNVFTEPSSLWPPNHEMVPVGVRFAAADTCGAGVRVELVSVTSSEPDDAPGGDDGQTTVDIQNSELGGADAVIDLRAERAGKGSGRTYTLTYRAVDLAGHATTAIGVVTVPHDQGQGPEPVLMRLERSGANADTRIYWPAVGDATSYDLIRGDLASLRADNGMLRLGHVAVLARGTTSTQAIEAATAEVTPPVGGGFFYLIQQTTSRGAVGYGTESAPWPRVPDACDGGCPGSGEAVATAPAGSASPGTGTRKR